MDVKQEAYVGKRTITISPMVFIRVFENWTTAAEAPQNHKHPNALLHVIKFR